MVSGLVLLGLSSEHGQTFRLPQGLRCRPSAFPSSRSCYHVRGADLAMRKHSTARSSRRAPALKDSDYDHEINLIDHAAEAVLAEPQPPSTAAALSPQRTDNALTTSETVETTKGETLYPHTITPSTTEDSQPGPSATQGQARSSSPGAKATRGRTSSVGVSVKSMKSKRLSKKSSLRMSTESGIVIPRVEINGKYLQTAFVIRHRPI